MLSLRKSGCEAVRFWFKNRMSLWAQTVSTELLSTITDMFKSQSCPLSNSSPSCSLRAVLWSKEYPRVRFLSSGSAPARHKHAQNWIWWFQVFVFVCLFVYQKDGYIFPGVGILPISHLTPASSEWPQLWTPHPAKVHWSRVISFPVQATSSIQIFSLPNKTFVKYIKKNKWK